MAEGDPANAKAAPLPADCASRTAVSLTALPPAPVLNQLADNLLMEYVALGRTEAFAVLVSRHTRALHRVASRMLGDRHEAEDVVQECFTRLWQQAPHWRPSGAGLVGWLYRATVNFCFDRYRRLRVVDTAEIPERADDAPLAHHLIEADQAHHAVAGSLADLPERYRAALVLCYYEGLTNAVAAEVLQLNIKAMESLLVRARKRMRELLEEREVTARDLALLQGERAA